MEGKKALKYILSLYPDEIGQDEWNEKYENVYVAYFKNLWIIAIYSIKNNNKLFKYIIQDLQSHMNDEREILNIFIIVKTLIVDSIEKNDTRLLTEVCYLGSNLIDSFEKIDENSQRVKNSAQHSIDKSLVNLIKGAKVHTTSFKKNKVNRYKGIFLFILIQAAVKGIELGHYPAVGFIIKYIVSTYDSKLINNTYSKVQEQDSFNDDKLDNYKLAKTIDSNFYINTETAIYCLKKFTLLLYLQQKYTQKRELIHLNIFSNDTSQSDDTFSFEYCFKKIQAVKDKYGLIFLTDTSFSDSLNGFSLNNNQTIPK